MFQRERNERTRDRMEMENYYYDVIYQVLNDPLQHVKKAVVLRKVKAKILRLYSTQQQGVLLDNGEQNGMTGEELSIHRHRTRILETWV